MISLAMAAEETGLAKSTIWRAIKSGRVSAARADDGTWSIDPAELFRAFPKRPENDESKQSATSSAALETEVRLLREMLDEMRRDRDAWRHQAERLVLPGPPASSSSAARSWWPWRRAG
jgi:hypothetical protein